MKLIGEYLGLDGQSTVKERMTEIAMKLAQSDDLDVQAVGMALLTDRSEMNQESRVDDERMKGDVMSAKVRRRWFWSYAEIRRGIQIEVSIKPIGDNEVPDQIVASEVVSVLKHLKYEHENPKRGVYVDVGGDRWKYEVKLKLIEEEEINRDMLNWKPLSH
jgi:hypothetical protein